MKKYILSLIILSLFFLATPKTVLAGHYKWSDWYLDSSAYGICHPNAECGTTQGTKYKLENRYCYWATGSGINECKQWQTETRESSISHNCTVSFIECPSPTPSAEPEVIQTPEPVVEQGLTVAGAPYCGGTVPATIPWAYAKRISSTSYMIFYVPTIVGGECNIRFKEQGKTEWEHALRDFPNLGIAPLGFLKENIKYDFQITNGNGCAQSAWSRVFSGI